MMSAYLSMFCCCFFHRTVAIPVYAKPQITYHEVNINDCFDKLSIVSPGHHP